MIYSYTMTGCAILGAISLLLLFVAEYIRLRYAHMALRIRYNRLLRQSAQSPKAP